MNTKLLEYMVKISEESNITRAAAQLFVTQSALDQQLLKLEKELGVRLFRRSKNQCLLTEAGAVYVQYAQRIINLKNEAYQIINDIAEKNIGTLSIGLTPERGIGMFMDVYPQFYKLFPNITVVPREIGVVRQLDMLRNEQMDIGFVTITPQSVPGIEFQEILQEHLVLAVPRSNPLAAAASNPGEPLNTIDLSLFRDEEFVLMFRESTQREIIDPLFEQAGFKPKLIFETASNHTLISMVARGLSCSIIADYYVEPNDQIAFFHIKEKPCWHLMAAYKRSRYLSRGAGEFISLATEYWKARQRLHEERLIAARQDAGSK